MLDSLPLPPLCRVVGQANPIVWLSSPVVLDRTYDLGRLKLYWNSEPPAAVGPQRYLVGRNGSCKKQTYVCGF